MLNAGPQSDDPCCLDADPCWPVLVHADSMLTPCYLDADPCRIHADPCYLDADCAI
jgi:hypothetical protein